MTAAGKREELEAAIWRALKQGGWATAVDAVLVAADEYAVEMVAAFLDQQTREQRTADRRERLADAVAETYGRASA